MEFDRCCGLLTKYLRHKVFITVEIEIVGISRNERCNYNEFLVRIDLRVFKQVDLFLLH